MAAPPPGPPGSRRPLEALRSLVEATTGTGQAFFDSLVVNLTRSLGVKHALVGELTEADPLHSRVLAVAWDGELGAPFTYALDGTPCERALEAGELAYYPSGVAGQFPRDVALARKGIQAYMGCPLLDPQGRRLGILVVLHDTPLEEETEPRTILRIFAARAAAELGRQRAEAAARELAAQLQHAQKMDAVGRLAGGIAHDFNNLLTVIRGFGELADEELAGHPARELVTPIRDAAERASALTRHLLSFARRQVLAPRVLDPNVLVAELGNLLRRLVGEPIRLELGLSPGAWPISIDPGQLEQVLVNLAVNARDAMPGGGELTVETANVAIDAAAAAPLVVPAGDYVRVRVRDTGTGMDEATAQHAFEPFFTTKGPERGTGLGLATCHGIVTQAGGAIRLESVPGRGTVVTLLLPRHAGQPSAAAPAAPRGAATGTETVLFVEDEEVVRAVGVRALTGLGYRVLSARDGEEALLAAAGHDGTIDLLVTDMVLPRLDGAELARRLLAARPGLRVLYTSGYSDRVPTAASVAFLQKPYTPAELGRRLREVLGAPPAGR